MDLSLLLDYVIPSDGILYKSCNGSWDFYKSGRDLEDGISYMSQDTNEECSSVFGKAYSKINER